MTMRTLLTALLLAACVLPIGAQQIQVEEYRQVKRTWLKRLLKKAVSADKQQATLDLYTGEKGFTFKAEGQTEVKAQEQDGMLTLLLPDKTRFLVIEHPDYGQHSWKIPESKGLRRKKHYQAVLHTSSPKKIFKPGKQWVVMDITPDNAVVTMDSTTTAVRNGKAQFFLPVGKHQYEVVSPFHHSVTDSLELTDSIPLNIPVTLQPFYSYITVNVPEGDYYVYIDGQFVGHGTSTSGHLMAGEHEVTLRRNKVYFYEQRVTVGPAEKVVVDIPADKLSPHLLAYRDKQVLSARQQTTAPQAPQDSLTTKTQQPDMVPVTIKAATEQTEIWVDRVHVGNGSWSGQLPMGFHAVNTQNDGLQSPPTYVFLDDTFPKTLDLQSPTEEYGMLNIHSNVVGATILINGQEVGTTPCLIERLPARYSYQLVVQKEGYKTVRKTVKPRGNDMVDVDIPMKK